MEDGNYINMKMLGDKAKLEELRTRDEFRVRSQTEGAIEGADIPFDVDEENEE
jgi:hypothetical protein